MNKLLAVVFMVVLAACGGSTPLPAPKTYDDLAAAYKAAHEAKDTARLGALFYWGSLSKDAQTRTIDRISRNTFAGKITEIKIVDLPKTVDLKSTNSPNPFPPEKRLEIDFEKGTLGALVGASYDVGRRDGRAWIICLTE